MLQSSLVEPTAAPVHALARPRGLARCASRPAAAAASRVFGASAAFGILGLAWALFVLARLLETWRVSPARAHELVLFGQRLSYPAANGGAIVVLALAVLGILVLGAGARGLVREIRIQRRLRGALAASTRLGPRRVWIVAGERPQVFCAGLLRPRVYLTLAALELLDESELAAVLAHECHHAKRRDPLRLACGRLLAEALFFLPALRRVVERQRSLAEIGADEAAVLDAAGERSALAGAMLSLSGSGPSGGVGLDPERVDFLLGVRTRLRFPIALCAGIALALSALTAVAVLAAQTAAGSLTLALPLASGQPCVLVLASIPLGTIMLGVNCCRRANQVTARASLNRN
jgi:Peptidase family M48